MPLLRSIDSPSGSAATQSRLERLRGEQISTLYRNAPLGMAATLVAGVLLEQFLLSTGGVSLRAMHIWVGVLTVQTLVRLALCEVYRRRKPPAHTWRSWAAVFSVGTLVGGLTWGIGSLWMMVPGHFDYQLLVVVMILALIYGSVSAFGIYLPAFCALTIPALLPVTIWGALQPDAAHHVFAALSALWLPVIVMLAWRHNRMATDSLNLRYENLDLLENLERQRDRAEEANIAKSQFLASASHDLRQPVHALGMFVGALRAHDMPVPARRLLGHIESSVSALDGLFSALLDISRLDAGVVQANVSVFALQPLLERICRDHEAEAAQKGLVLTLMPCMVVIRSDAVLLERVLRNIVSNALRYTVRGRVLVGCRRQNGTLSIEVWDTGVGIAEAHRERVFQEFYQVANPGRDRSQGLGLGLAIVRRLTQLLGHPLTLRSQPAHGSVFKVAVPLAQSQKVPAEIARPEARAGRGLILVIDDEVAIQEAMRSLLESWGHSVITAGSGAQMLEQIADCSSRPALIICDYRLHGEDGIAVIQRLQQEFNDEIPAMLVTGDTAPSRLLEARESGYMLLHKPLSAERLRAAIGAVHPQ
jgi:two-component system, sensor histidine kinase